MIADPIVTEDIDALTAVYLQALSSDDEMPPLVDSSSDDDMPPIMNFEHDRHRHRYGIQSPPTSDDEPDSDDEDDNDDDDNAGRRPQRDDDPIDPDDDDDGDGDDDDEGSEDESEEIDPLAGQRNTCGMHHHHQCWACTMFVGVNMLEVQTTRLNDQTLPVELRKCGRDSTHMDPPGASSEIPWDWHLCRRCIRDLLDILDDDDNRTVAGPPDGPEAEPVTLVIRRLQWIYTMIAPYIGNAGGEPWERGFNHIEYNVHDEGAVFDDPTVEWSPVHSDTEEGHVDERRTLIRTPTIPPFIAANPQNRSGIHRLHHPPYAGYNHQDFEERLPLHLYGFHNLYRITEDFAQNAQDRYTQLIGQRYWSCLMYNHYHGPFENPNPGTQTSLQRDWEMNADDFGYDSEVEGGEGTEADDESPTNGCETDHEADAGTVTGASGGGTNRGNDIESTAHATIQSRENNEAEDDDIPDIAPAAPAQPFSSLSNPTTPPESREPEDCASAGPSSIRGSPFP